MDTRSFILLLPKKSKNILHTHLKQAPKKTSHETKRKSSCKTGAFSWKKPDYFNLVSL